MHIADWDLNWQAVYRLKEPMPLPKGTVVSMRWTYDNSRGTSAIRTIRPSASWPATAPSDEMAHLWLQVLPQRPEDRAAAAGSDDACAAAGSIRATSWRW